MARTTVSPSTPPCEIGTESLVPVRESARSSVPTLRSSWLGGVTGDGLSDEAGVMRDSSCVQTGGGGAVDPRRATDCPGRFARFEWGGNVAVALPRNARCRFVLH